ncbi:hypothetical protein BC629DRAFT_1521058 [Irpex lacteus]|nr:hypothetical protein BC629DRAFT_1521058 [Irpex lacteus]
MSYSHSLHNDSAELLLAPDEEAKLVAEIGEVRVAPYSHVSAKKASTLLKLVFAVCLIMSASLASSNLWASQQLAIALTDALPAPNVTHLAKADQYDGLSESSRRKRKWNTNP